MMLRSLVVIAIIVGGAFLITKLFPSDEDRIREQVMDLVEAFNKCHTKSFLAPLDPTFEDSTSGTKRDEIKRGLKIAFAQIRDIRGRFPYRVAVEERFISVTPDLPDWAAASVRFPMQLIKGSNKSNRLEWEAEIEIECYKTDQGWRFKRSTHKSVSGKRPF